MKKTVEGFIKDWYVLDFMHAFLHCLSSQNYIVKLGAIDMTQCFFGR